MLSVQTAPIIGLPKFQGWSQVITNASGKLVCAFAIKGEDANNFGRDLAEKLISSNPQNSAELHQLLLDSIQEVREAECQLQFSAGLFQKPKSCFATYSGSVFLGRNSKSGTILHSQNEPKLIEGQANIDDLFVLTTFQATKFLEEIKQKSKQGFDVDTIITSVVPNVHSQHDSSLSSIAFVSIKTPETKEKTAQFVTQQVEQQEDLAQEKSKIERSNKSKPNILSKLLKKIWDSIKYLSEKINFSKVLSLPKIVIIFLVNLVAQLWKRKVAFNKISKLVSKNEQGYKSESTLLTKSRRPTLKFKTGGFKPPSKIAGTILSLLLIGAFFGWQRMLINQELSQINSKLEPTIQLFEEAKNLSQTDIFASREKINQVLGEIETLSLETKDKPRSSKIVKDYLYQVQEFSQSISGVSEKSELELFFDLRLVESGFVASSAEINDTSAIFLDQEEKRVIVLDLEKKQSKLINLGDEKFIDLAANTSQLYLLNNGIFEIDLTKDDGQPNRIAESGSSNQDGIFIKFFGSFLYVFNPEKRNIYRYIIEKDGLSEPIGWLTNKTGLEFSQIVSMAIDGDIWLTSKSGQLKKFTQGEEQTFNIQGLIEPFNSPIYVFTLPDLDSLYVMEPDQKRVVILNKQGQFLQEIVSQSLASATSILYSPTINKILAVSGSLVFEINP